MFTVQKSALFMRQWQQNAQGYKERTGINIAERFVAAVEEALCFIRQNPHACAIYDTGEGYEDLQAYQFRKWNLRGFPYIVLFRLSGNTTILIEVLYAHKMDMHSRLATDMESQ